VGVEESEDTSSSWAGVDGGAVFEASPEVEGVEVASLAASSAGGGGRTASIMTSCQPVSIFCKTWIGRASKNSCAMSIVYSDGSRGISERWSYQWRLTEPW